MDDSSADEVGQEWSEYIVIPYVDDSIYEEVGEEAGGEHVIEKAINDDHGTNETVRDEENSYEEFVEEVRFGYDVDNWVNKDDMTTGGNTCAYHSNGKEEEYNYNVMGPDVNEYDETRGWSAWMAFGGNLAANCTNENIEATGIESNADDSTDEVLGEERGEHVVGGATPDNDRTNEVLLYEEIVWEARVDHDACANEDDDANCCDEVLGEEWGEHVVGEATSDDDRTNEVLLYEETVLEARVDHHVNNCVNGDADANCCDEVLGEEWSERVVGEAIPDNDGPNEVAYEVVVWETHVYGSDNEEESIDGNEEEYGSDTHSEYSISSHFETDPATPQQINTLPTSVVSQEQLSQLSEDFCSICFSEFGLDQEIKRPPCLHIFHTECLNTWLSKDRRCPHCRMSCCLV